ncbi:MAG: hypothetical protein J6Z23_07495 [Lachnospiraceae bacterium]|nr:hypothetical protein [Lachnospiraceae bacterium]MBP5255205.1 hypothetical protein [Lachnospiraceae bacterium]
MECDTCAFYAYDEDEEAWFCEADMDEDDFARLRSADYKGCPYWQNGDEYAVVRHQM